MLDGRPTATCYRHEEGRCTNPNCRLWVRQPGDGEILRAKIGPQARGLFLRFDIGLPFRKVVGAIECLDSLSFTPAAAVAQKKSVRPGRRSPRRWSAGNPDGSLSACSTSWQSP